MGSSEVRIVFKPSGKSVNVPSGTELIDAAATAGVDISLPCGGVGRCGKCKVLFESGACEPSATELDVVSEIELAQGFRLACQTTLCQDAVVYVPDGLLPAKALTVGKTRDVAAKPMVFKRHAAVPKPSTSDLRSDMDRVLDTLKADEWEGVTLARSVGKALREADFNVTGVFHGNRLAALEAGDTTGECYGVALDVGTTTMAAYLVDLNAGEQVAVASVLNPQTQVGDDVISRISHVLETPDGLDHLRKLVTDSFNSLIDDLLKRSGVKRERVYEAVVVGNTCMTHLFMGVNPGSLAVAPYVPAVSGCMCAGADDLGIGINPGGYVYVLPCVAGYVGADTLGVLLSTGLYESDKYLLAVDIGTNGEIVAGSRDRLVACSTAAGPAFEGAHISSGMRAAPGAIDAVWLDGGEIKFSAIDGAAPVGICGSGLLDVIICLIDAGIIDPSGRIRDSEEITGAYSHLAGSVRSGDKGNEFVLVEPGIVVSQRDVREVQLAKGAIAAGILTLLDRLGISADDLDGVLVAGAFGNYLRKESAIAAGMLPDIERGKVHSVGNAAGEGAKLALVSRDLRQEAERIARSIDYVELTVDPGFQDRFADSLMFG